MNQPVSPIDDMSVVFNGDKVVNHLEVVSHYTQQSQYCCYQKQPMAAFNPWICNEFTRIRYLTSDFLPSNSLLLLGLEIIP